MKQFFLPLFLLLVIPVTAIAQKPTDINKAVVRLVTFNAAGDTLQSANAYFCSENADIVAPFQAFRGAARAEIVDSKGKRAEVLRIAGASNAFDIVKATTNAETKKLVFLTPSPQPPTTAAEPLHQAFYSTDKKAQPFSVQVLSIHRADGFTYYDLTTPNEEKFVGCPVVNAEGKVVCIMQKSILKEKPLAFGVDARAADSLRISSTSIFNIDLNEILIPQLVPTHSEQEAFSYIYMVLRSKAGAANKLTAIADFQKAFPKNAEIIGEIATYHTGQGEFQRADQVLTEAIDKGLPNAADLCQLRSDLILDKVARAEANAYPAWTLDAALAAARQGASLSNAPKHLLQQGVVLLAMERNREAYELFQKFNATPEANAQSYTHAATALARDKGDTTQVIALLDSAINLAGENAKAALAPLLARAMALAETGEYRRAVLDLAAYEKLATRGTLNDYFYYIRSRFERNTRMYQQALNDLETAITLTRNSESRVNYLIERTQIYLQVGMFEEAGESAKQLLAVEPDNLYGHRFLGISLGEQGQKVQALQSLNRAEQLGDDVAPSLIEKYRKLPEPPAKRSTAPRKRR